MANSAMPSPPPPPPMPTQQQPEAEPEQGQINVAELQQALSAVGGAPSGGKQVGQPTSLRRVIEAVGENVLGKLGQVNQVFYEHISGAERRLGQLIMNLQEEVRGFRAELRRYAPAPPCIFCSRSGHSTNDCRTYATTASRLERLMVLHRCGRCMDMADGCRNLCSPLCTCGAVHATALCPMRVLPQHQNIRATPRPNKAPSPKKRKGYSKTPGTLKKKKWAPAPGHAETIME